VKIRTVSCCTLAVSLAVAGCASSGSSGNQAKAGAVGCGAAVALEVAIGGFGSTVAQCLAGGAVGLAVGAVLDEREKQALADARERAADTNARVDWSAPPPAENSASPQNAATSETGGAPAESSPPPTHPKKTPKKPAAAPKPSPAPTPAPATESPGAKSGVIANDTGAKPAAPTASGWIVPVKTYAGKGGNTCRDLKEHTEKGTKKIDDNVTLCKAAAGWVLPQTSG
jgi:hypothetical protein